MLDDPFERRVAERRYTMNFLDYEIVSAEGEIIGRGLARTLNVSATGLLLETAQFFEPGQALRITLGLANELVQVTGQVVHAEPVNDDLCCAGVHFIEFAPHERRVFQRYFKALRKTTAN